MKDKQVMISSPTNGGEDNLSDDKTAAADSLLPCVRFSSRNGSSKYDFVKVKVWLGNNADHYYVLSRFLLSRMLTVTKIPNHVAIKIALELKKLLIDNSLLDVSQSDLEANLFKLMERRGYGEEYINRYKMMTRFHHQRVPLVILVCGTACVGKSTIATQLAQRLNLPNVLQTDMVYELLRTSTDAPLASTPVWGREFNSSEELITEFCRECRIVRKGLAGDMKKAMKDGKSIIIEGIHLDPSIYLMDEENKSPRSLPSKIEELHAASLTLDDNTAAQLESNPARFLETHSEIKSCSFGGVSIEVGTSTDQVNDSFDSFESVITENVSEKKGHEGETSADIEKEKNHPGMKKLSGAEPIIVPIVLKMAEFDHKALLEEWVCCRRYNDRGLLQDKDMLMRNLKTIQSYICSFKSQGLTVANISASTFPQTLDWLHNHLLQCIEQGMSAASNAIEGQPSKK